MNDKDDLGERAKRHHQPDHDPPDFSNVPVVNRIEELTPSIASPKNVTERFGGWKNRRIQSPLRFSRADS
ncbi:hypothetical protein BMJ33_14105 [Sinorhizobium medicae]|uniref:Uncharacterized protein n=1 Tax=Sinorhizobium medicae TaxID=110321 RepID=A0ABX4TNB9_9HYPH|nr:hypothetical protein BMJ33_14105 [Sinorhizobium medicae]